MKKISFLLSLPRSGNTLFSSIINQNPDMAVTAMSVTLEIIKNIYGIKEEEVFKNYPDHKSLDNVLASVYNSYYKDWNYKHIIDRGPVMTPENFILMKQYLGQPIKCIVIWRDLLDVLASYIKWFKNEPTAFPNKWEEKTLEEKLFRFMNMDGTIAKNLTAIQNVLKPENKHMCHFLTYDQLVDDTENQINKLYDFLEMPRFKHNLKSLNQFKVNGISYDDTVVGNRMHTIREVIKKEENPYRAMIPESIIKAYGHIVL